jgi:hypothetical protein
MTRQKPLPRGGNDFGGSPQNSRQGENRAAGGDGAGHLTARLLTSTGTVKAIEALVLLAQLVDSPESGLLSSKVSP